MPASSQPPAPASATDAAPPAAALDGLLDADHAALLARRISINVATRDRACTPHLLRAVGLRLDPGGRAVTLLLWAAQAADVLADITDNQAIAVVCSEPTTHQTLQLKGFDARESPLQPGDPALCASYRERLADELADIGFARDMVRAFLQSPGEQLVAVTFTPAQAFRQTPGARAGEALGAARP
jgi:hypothetical protein